MTNTTPAFPLRELRRLFWLPGILMLVLLLVRLSGQVGVGGWFLFPAWRLHSTLSGLFKPTFSGLLLATVGYFSLGLALVRRAPKWTRFSMFFVLLAVPTLCGYMSPAFDTGWRVLDAVDFDGARYRLFVYESASDGHYYYIHRCEVGGLVCGPALAEGTSGYAQSVWAYNSDAQFVIEGETLRVIQSDTDVLFEVTRTKSGQSH